MFVESIVAAVGVISIPCVVILSERRVEGRRQVVYCSCVGCGEDRTHTRRPLNEALPQHHLGQDLLVSLLTNSLIFTNRV